MYLLVKVEDNVIYLWGETFALIDKGKSESVVNGWYYATTTDAVLVDKKGTPRKYATIRKSIDVEDLQELLNIYWGTNIGLKTLCTKYRMLVPQKICDDSRFHTLKSLLNFGYCLQITRTDEMRKFIEKIVGIVLDKIIRGVLTENYKEEPQNEVDTISVMTGEKE